MNLRFDHIKTRKEHTCFLCGLRIRKNAKCYSWSCVDCGNFNSGYYHEVCYDHFSNWDEIDMENFSMDHAAFRGEELGMTGFLKMSIGREAGKVNP